MRKAWLAASLGLLALVSVPAALAGSQPSARAQATVATGSAGVFRQVAVRGNEEQSASGAVSQPGISIGSSQANAQGTLSDRDALAEATAVARSVSLFDGLVTAYGVRRAARAAGGAAAYSGAVNGLKIDGRTIGDVSEAATYEFDGGSVTVNSGTQGLLVTLTQARQGYAAGMSVAVAEVSAEASAAKQAQPERTPAPTAEPEAESDDEEAERRREARKRRRERLTRPPERLIGAPGYVFPVDGEAVVADDFHGPRQIGKHQGNDIFAPFGTPIRAVADGVVRKVGTLPISGNRLWLRTEAGDEYFYAHMSSFSPRAQNRRRVKAGAILGFVGNTGDAEPTPPHLHFEVHPGGERSRAVDPHSILLSWQAAGGARLGLAAGRPGALVEVRDFLDE